MKPRDYILEQIHHRETSPVPFTLGFEGDVAECLDEYYRSKSWRERLIPYIVGIGGVDTCREEQINDTHVRDVFGGLWRTDRRPLHLEKPALKEPSFVNNTFPRGEQFLDTD